MEQGKVLGELRHSESRKRGLAKSKFENDMSIQKYVDIDVSGARGEIAFSVAMFLDCPMSVNAAKIEPDVYPDWQIRTTKYNSGRLILRDNDIEHHKYALVIDNAPAFFVVGWILGSVGKAMTQFEDNPNDKKAVIMIPQSSLMPFTTEMQNKYYEDYDQRRTDLQRQTG